MSPDSRFYWNEPSVQPLLEDVEYFALMPHVIPLTSAFCGVQQNVSLTSTLRYDELLISRRSRFRAGTRFTKRGADATGAVANYAETEQLCWLYNNHDTATSVESCTDTGIHSTAMVESGRCQNVSTASVHWHGSPGASKGRAESCASVNLQPMHCHDNMANIHNWSL